MCAHPRPHTEHVIAQLVQMDALHQSFGTNPLNPNEHPDEQIELLAQIIGEVGWRDPITISNRSGFIVRGHGRFAAAALLKMKSVPVEYHDYDSEEEETADLIADNRIQELSYLDPERVRELINKISDDSRWVMTAFDQDEIESIMGDSTGFLNGFTNGVATGQSGTAVNGQQSGTEPATTGDPDPVTKYYKLPYLMTEKERDFILSAVSVYQVKREMNMSSEAFLRMMDDFERGME